MSEDSQKTIEDSNEESNKVEESIPPERLITTFFAILIKFNICQVL